MSELEPVQVAANWDRDARGYDTSVQHFTRRFALDAVELLGIIEDHRVLGGFVQVNVFSVRHLWCFRSPEWMFERLAWHPDATSSSRRSAPIRGNASECFAANLRERFGDSPFALAGDANIAIGRA